MDWNGPVRVTPSAAVLAIGLLLMLSSVGSSLDVARAQEEHEASIDMILYGEFLGTASAVVDAGPGDRIRLAVDAVFNPTAGDIPALAVWLAEEDPYQALTLIGWSPWFSDPEEPICGTIRPGFCYRLFVLSPAQGEPITLSESDTYFLFEVPGDVPSGYRGLASVELRYYAPGEADPDNYSPLSEQSLDVVVEQGAVATVESSNTPAPVTPTPTRKPPTATATVRPSPPAATHTPRPVPVTEAAPSATPGGGGVGSGFPRWGWVLLPLLIGGGIWFLRALFGGQPDGRELGPTAAPEGSPPGEPQPKQRRQPTIRFTSPERNEVVPPSGFPLVVAYAPGSSQLNLSTLKVAGPDPLGMVAKPTEARCDWEATQPLPHGPATVVARIADQAGEWAQSQTEFIVDAAAPDLCLHLTWIGEKAPPEKRKVQWKTLIGGRIDEGPDPAPIFPASRLLLAFWVKERPAHNKAAGLERASIELVADWTLEGVDPGANLLDRFVPWDLSGAGGELAPLVHLTEDNERVVKGHLLLDESLIAGGHCFSLFAADKFGNTAQIDLLFATSEQRLAFVNQEKEIPEAVRAIGKGYTGRSRDRLGRYLFAVQYEDPATDAPNTTQTVILACKDGKDGTVGQPREVVLERKGGTGPFRSEFLVAYTDDHGDAGDRDPPLWAIPVDPDTRLVGTLVWGGQAMARVECPVTVPALKIRRLRVVVREIRDGSKFTSRSTLTARLATEGAPLPRQIALELDGAEVGAQDVRPTGENPREGLVSFHLDKAVRFDEDKDHRFTLSAVFDEKELGAARPIAVQTRSCDLHDARVELGNCEAEHYALHLCLPFNPYAGMPAGKAPAKIAMEGQSLAVRPGRFYCVVELTPRGDRVAVRLSGHVGGQGFLSPHRAEYPDREDRARFAVVGQGEPKRLRFTWLAKVTGPATQPSKCVLDMAAGTKILQLAYSEHDPYAIDEDLASAREMPDAWYVLSLHTVIAIEPKIDAVQFVSGQARREGSDSVIQLAVEKQQPRSGIVVESGGCVDATFQVMARDGKGAKCPAAEGVPLDCTLDTEGCAAGYTFVEAGMKLARQSHHLHTDKEGRICASLWIPHIEKREEQIHLKIGKFLDLPIIVKRRVVGAFEFVDEAGQVLDPVWLNDGASSLCHEFYLQFRLIGNPALSEIDKRIVDPQYPSDKLSSVTTSLAARGGAGDGFRDVSVKEVVLRQLDDQHPELFRSPALSVTDLETVPKGKRTPGANEIWAKCTETLAAPVKQITLKALFRSCVVKPVGVSRYYRPASAGLAPVRIEVESLAVSLRLDKDRIDAMELQGRFSVQAPKALEGKTLKVLSLRLRLCGVDKAKKEASLSLVVKPPHGSIELDPEAPAGPTRSTYLFKAKQPVTDLVHYRSPELLPFDLTKPLGGQVTVTYRYAEFGRGHGVEYDAVSEIKVALLGATEVRVPETPFNPLLPDQRGEPQSFDVVVAARREHEQLAVTFRDGQSSAKTAVRCPGKKVAVRYDPLTRTIVAAGEKQESTWLGSIRTVAIDVDPAEKTVPPFALVVRHRWEVKVEPSIHAEVEEVELQQQCEDTFANGSKEIVNERFVWKWTDKGPEDAGWVGTAASRVRPDHLGPRNQIVAPGDAEFFQHPPRTDLDVHGRRTTLIRAKPGATVTMKVRMRTRRGENLVTLAQGLPIAVRIGRPDVELDKALHNPDEVGRATVRTHLEGGRSTIKLQCSLVGSYPFCSNVKLDDPLYETVTPAVLEMPYVTIDYVMGPAEVDVMAESAMFYAGPRDYTRLKAAPERERKDVLEHIEWYVHSHYYPTGGAYPDKAKRRRLGADTSMVVPVKDEFVDKDGLIWGEGSSRPDKPLLYVTVKSANTKTVYATALTEEGAYKCPSTVWHVTGLRLHTLGWPLLVDLAAGWGGFDATCLRREQLEIGGACYIFRVGSGAGFELPFFRTTFCGFIQGARSVDDLGGWYYGPYTELGFLGQGVKAIRVWRSGREGTVSMVLVDSTAPWYGETVASMRAARESMHMTVLKSAWDGAVDTGMVTPRLDTLKIKDLASVKLSMIYVYLSPRKPKRRDRA